MSTASTASLAGGLLFHAREQDPRPMDRGLPPSRMRREEEEEKDSETHVDIMETDSDKDGGFHTATRAKGEERSIGEEAWSLEGEDLAREWGKIASSRSEKHNVVGLKNKCLYQGLGFPAVLIPGVMAIVSPVLPLDEEYTRWVNMSFFAISAGLSAAVSFFGFATLHQKHMDYSARYGDVASDVKYELIKARRYRTSQDEFLMKIQMKMDHLSQNAPDL